MRKRVSILFCYIKEIIFIYLKVMGMHRSKDKGFTLVELVVVIVILAILIGVSIAGYTKYIGQSKINTDLATINILVEVVVAAQVEEGVYEELLNKTPDDKYIIVVNNDGAEIQDYDENSYYMKAINDQLNMENGVSSKFKMEAVKTYYDGYEYKVVAEPNGEGQVRVYVDES